MIDLDSVFPYWDVLFTNWDGRPAILLMKDGSPVKAYAVLGVGGGWVDVDYKDVWYTASVMPKAVFRARFEMFLSNIDLVNFRDDLMSDILSDHPDLSREDLDAHMKFSGF